MHLTALKIEYCMIKLNCSLNEKLYNNFDEITVEIMQYQVCYWKYGNEVL